jgi:hypothetical protein
MNYRYLTREELLKISQDYLACIEKVNIDLANTSKEEFGWVNGKFIKDPGVELAWDCVERFREAYKNLPDPKDRVSLSNLTAPLSV